MLYVADITVVRLFDLKTGAPKGEVKVPGATFLNDISVAKDGRVFDFVSRTTPTAGRELNYLQSIFQGMEFKI